MRAEERQGRTAATADQILGEIRDYCRATLRLSVEDAAARQRHLADLGSVHRIVLSALALSLLSGLAIQAALFGVPFFAAGTLKIAYDLGLYAGFRRRRAEHETHSG